MDYPLDVDYIKKRLPYASKEQLKLIRGILDLKPVEPYEYTSIQKRIAMTGQCVRWDQLVGISSYRINLDTDQVVGVIPAILDGIEQFPFRLFNFGIDQQILIDQKLATEKTITTIDLDNDQVATWVINVMQESDIIGYIRIVIDLNQKTIAITPSSGLSDYSPTLPLELSFILIIRRDRNLNNKDDPREWE